MIRQQAYLPQDIAPQHEWCEETSESVRLESSSSRAGFNYAPLEAADTVYSWFEERGF